LARIYRRSIWQPNPLAAPPPLPKKLEEQKIRVKSGSNRGKFQPELRDTSVVVVVIMMMNILLYFNVIYFLLQLIY
jgi:hypothetical protein